MGGYSALGGIERGVVRTIGARPGFPTSSSRHFPPIVNIRSGKMEGVLGKPQCETRDTPRHPRAAIGLILRRFGMASAEYKPLSPCLPSNNGFNGSLKSTRIGGAHSRLIAADLCRRAFVRMSTAFGGWTGPFSSFVFPPQRIRAGHREYIRATCSSRGTAVQLEVHRKLRRLQTLRLSSGASDLTALTDLRPQWRIPDR
ncbi:hypothetical protein N7532_007716 [Penicillium argentinense]|uniref:Uncharacterized protein n=1 Tax=Penicillium argentinense TaxID=1131581 RepID=A0A9W9EW17_9EURO|nr:uncharacterized protein N7532_007716 [Penicillium argentinense]KAJ5089032.1 hypothetical protein N7532_007716 [Penicillium argentinense]